MGWIDRLGRRDRPRWRLTSATSPGFGNFRVTTTSSGAGGFDQFSLTVPRDARCLTAALPIDGLYDARREVRQGATVNTLSDKYGKWTEHWNGVDVSLNARLQNGITLRGGVSTGSRAVDMCDVTSKIPEFLFGPAGVNLGDNNNNIFLPNAFCHQEEPFLTQIKGAGILHHPVIGGHAGRF